MDSRSIINNLVKDVRLEFRNRTAVSISISFALIVTLASALAAGGVPLSPAAAAIFLWIIFFFCAMNGLSHIFLREIERGTRIFLNMNSSPEELLAGKMIFNVVFFAVIQIIATPAFLFFFQIAPADPVLFAASVASGGLALSTGSTILGAMAARAGGKGALFTVISFPVLLPPLWTAISLTKASIEGAGRSYTDSIFFLLAFSGAVIFISFIIFRYIWLEE